jgi:hypothetical protein
MLCPKCGVPNFDDALLCKACAVRFAFLKPTGLPPLHSDNVFGTACKWGTALWTLICLYGAFSAIGPSLGLGFWAVVWLVPTVAAAALDIAFGRTSAPLFAASAAKLLAAGSRAFRPIRRPALISAGLIALVVVPYLTRTHQAVSASASSPPTVAQPPPASSQTDSSAASNRADTPAEAVVKRLLSASNQQQHAADSARDYSLSRQYEMNFLAYRMAACDELEHMPEGSDPSILESCANVRATVVKLPAHVKSTIEDREFHFRLATLQSATGSGYAGSSSSNFEESSASPR